MKRHRAEFAALSPLAGMTALACILALSGVAQAQIVTPDSVTPLAPRSAQPRAPQTFQTFTPQQQAQLSAPPTFTPPASGAGNTGYDSTNSRRRTRVKPGSTQPAVQAPRIPGDAARAQALTTTQTPLTLAPSPSSSAVPAAARNARASVDGAPPVEFGPIRRPLKKRKAFEDDPYAPLGWSTGPFTLYPAVELTGGYATNPGQSADAQGATLYSIQPELRAQSNWARHELTADLRGSYTGYTPDTTPTLSRPYANGKVDGRVDVTRTTRVDLGGRALVSTDNPGSPNLQAGISKLPIYTTFGGSVGLGQKFNRFDVSLKGDVDRTSYQDSQLTDGTTASNKDRNYDQYGLKLRGGYETLPGVMPYIEIGADTRRHDLATDFYGYQRNSKGWTAIVGSTFELSRLLTGETGIGWTERSYDDPRFSKLSGFVGNASLIWTVDALTAVKFDAKSAVQESIVPGVSGVLSRDFGVQVDHSFRRWLIGTAKAGFGKDTYKGANIPASTTITTNDLCQCVVSTTGGTSADRVDDRYMLGLGLTYKLSRWAQVKGEFRQDWLRSNVTSANYTASTFMVGLRLQQ